MAHDMTEQDQRWAGQFGQEYTDRNCLKPGQLDDLYLECFGTYRMELNLRFLRSVPRETAILEVGCNTGMQLRHLQLLGFTDLHGIELQQYAIDHLCVENVGVRQGSVYKLPYADAEFGLVFTSGLLIHLPSHMLLDAIREILRVSRHWIWGFEYYSAHRRKVEYRGQKDMLWTDDYPSYFLYGHNGLGMTRRWSEVHRAVFPGVVADMYLLEKL